MQRLEILKDDITLDLVTIARSQKYLHLTPTQLQDLLVIEEKAHLYDEQKPIEN